MWKTPERKWMVEGLEQKAQRKAWALFQSFLSFSNIPCSKSLDWKWLSNGSWIPGQWNRSQGVGDYENLISFSSKFSWRLLGDRRKSLVFVELKIFFGFTALKRKEHSCMVYESDDATSTYFMSIHSLHPSKYNIMSELINL